ncbi:MAG: S46 family peptidase [Gemmatimonadales bacterium]|nr:S46 family peptidase [Gemmatimonadales bacterium]NIN50674.1 S46 family peptidase [Gemmatimonadales bacterium]NIP08138.1 S46 family peptidase [Gemmatimonadales bacterium]NIR01016.1 S46 family peptidase [Gemmatimonadales bacterium]NIS65095.1 S46 family peptidase [Gemmatimonadales bacterium]
MSRYLSYPYSLVGLALLTAACASAGPPPGQAAAPVAAPPETVVVAQEEALEPIEPGRFDMGRMWTFEDAPVDLFEEVYGFRPTEEWLTQVRLASLRLPNCTASFVSPNGLVMSNHHCARSATTRVTREGENLLDDGFYAATLAEERGVPNLWVDQLVRMDNVTELVESAVDPTARDEVQVQTRRQRMSAIGDSAGSAHGLRCSVTSLYQGGKYSMYCFKRYTDVRLVFVPELQIGYYGGDPDNYTYPRYVLDVSFFRVYDENGDPYRPAQYLGWSEEGANEGDPVFVIGNPGSTERLSTMAQLEFYRDYREPFIVSLLKTRTDILARYMEHHPEQRSRYINQYFGWMNSLKRYAGREKALNDPAIMARKLGWEQQVREAVAGNPELNRKYGALWDEIADLRKQMAEYYPIVLALNLGGSTRSQTLATAAGMLEYAQAVRGGAPDSVLQRLRNRLSQREIDTRLDGHFLEAQIGDVIKFLGRDDPFAQQALAGQSPPDAARALIAAATAVTDPEARRALLDSPADILSSTDPALSLVRETVPRVQQASGRFQQLSNAENVRTAKLGRAVFDLYGTSQPPDGTFTLRIQDGVVKSYDYNGTKAPAWTTFYGLYDRHYSHKDAADWALPDRWLDPPPEFDMSTPLNMCSTNDTVGGNSGSALINKDREVVGLLFDGNIESLSGYIINVEDVRRSISVRAEAIVEALRHIYGAGRVVQELLGQ